MPHLTRTILCCLASLVFYGTAIGQQDTSSSFVDIRHIGVEKRIYDQISSAYISKTTDPEQGWKKIAFRKGLPHAARVPVNRVGQKLLLRFPVCNSADSGSAFYFCPGFYYTDIRLYRETNGSLVGLPAIYPPIADSLGYRLIKLAAHDTAWIIAELSFVKTYNNSVRPRLINASHLGAFIAELQEAYRQTDQLTYVFCGLLLMMLLFSIANFLQGANPDFLYYSLYAFFLGGMLFVQTRFHFRTNNFSYFLEGYLDFILQSTGIIFYMLFMQRFLNTGVRHPFLYKLYRFGIFMLGIAMILYSGFYYLTDFYPAVYIVENITKIMLLLMIIVFLVYGIRHWNDRLLRFLFWGNFFLFLFSLLSQTAVWMNGVFKTLPGVFSSSVIYYEMGLLLELVFFLSGLNYKNRRQLITQTRERETLKAQNKLKEYEMELAVFKAQQAERERISADMHDELGSGMTAIRLMSEIARNKMKENTPVEIDKISSSADDVLNNMNAIIWSMNSGNDTLDNLVSYIRAYVLEYFDNTPVTCTVQVPDTLPDLEITGDKRRNVFLCVKETLNNVLKHAKATQVTIAIYTDRSLHITIHDNGAGIELQKLRRFGNGLINMQRRMESIGGTFTIEANDGTVTRLELPLQ